MNGRTQQNKNSQTREDTLIFDAAFIRVSKLIGVVLLTLVLMPTFLNAQEDILGSGEGSYVMVDIPDGSGAETEDAIHPSGGDFNEGVGGPPDHFDLSGGDERDIEPYQVSPGPDDELIVETLEGELFELPDISTYNGEELPGLELSTGEEERSIFNARPFDPFYELVVSESPTPDITRLGPLPEILEEGVEFTDVAGDWIYHQKSAGLTEIRGHCMVIYDTLIISSDEALLDEKNEVYRFFGEGRVFVDDADFTLECDELEIHDAEEEKMIYITGQSTMLVYADLDAEEPGDDSVRRDRLNYALKQHDTIITFTDAEYDYENDIFDAHNGVRFEQPDKSAEGDEFHGENETEYVLFTGNCEFWQRDGQWLYEHRIVEDEEDPPSRGDKITRALMSVPTKITCDEFESEVSGGWLQMRSVEENVVYFHQDDKHAECDYFTMFFTDSDAEEEDDDEEIIEEPRNLLEDEEIEDEVEEEEEEIWIKPPGYGSLRLASEFLPDYVPWEQPEAVSIMPLEEGEIGIADWGEPFEGEIEQEDTVEEGVESSGEGVPGFDPELYGLSGEASAQVEEYLEGMMGTDPGVVDPSIQDPFNQEAPSIPGEAPPEAVEEAEPVEEHDSMEFLLQREDTEMELVTEGIPEEFEGGRDEIFMHGNVFIRQENGEWLFEFDIVNEDEETEENIEQYKKWANGSCDMLHVWTVDEVAEAVGAVYGEQDNQNLATDFAKYIADLDMVYLLGNVRMNREDKHSLLSNEAFMFLTTNVFEALGAVRTRVMVDVEEERDRGEEEGEGEGEAEE